MKHGTLGPPRRRQFLRVLGAGGVVAVSGCVGGGERGDPDDGDADAGDWQAVTLEDTTSGEEFRIEELPGPTLVHTFASHCLTCTTQQAEFVTLRERRDDIDIVELSVDPNDRPEDIASYAERAGMAWAVGVAPERVMGGLVDEFGREVSISAQSPVIIVCADGTTDTVRKVADADELEGAIAETC